MATEKKLTRKELLKEPDEFLTISSKLAEYINRHRTQAICAVCAFFLIIASVLGVQYMFKKSELTSFTLLSQATKKYKKSLADSDAEKAYLNVAGDFDVILDRYPNKNGGELALMTYAGICMDAGKIDKAIGLYTQVLDKFEDAPFVVNAAQSAIAYAFEAKKEYRTAAVWFQRLASDDHYAMKDAALFNLGRLYETLGETEKSAAAFKRILEEFSDSPYANLVKFKSTGSLGS